MLTRPLPPCTTSSATTSTSSAAVQAVLRGIAAASGRVVAPISRWVEPEWRQAPEAVDGSAGADRLRAALDEVRDNLGRSAAALRGRGAEAEAGILDAQALMVDDPSFVEPAFGAIAEGRAAEIAVQEAMEPFRELLRSSDDPVFKARATDVEDVVAQVTRALRGAPPQGPAPAVRSILVARDLTPSQTAALDPQLVAGFATELGTATAHTAILARALGLPAVVGLHGVMQATRDGQLALLDGDDGTMVLDPPGDVQLQVPAPVRRADPEPASTRDERHVEVGCNAGSLEDVRRAAEAGADGIGLLRTEFLFLRRNQLPDEKEQASTLEEILRTMAGRPVIMRTLDVGADKPLPALPQPSEENPALGVRGLRLQLLRNPELLRAQARAALRVAADHPIRLMLPMVANVDEVRQARRLIEEASRDLDPATKLPVGIMIEVPAAALAAGTLVKEVDFVSLGTNDLTQYAFAADRTNPAVAYLADSLEPSLLRLIADVTTATRRAGRWAGVCGEMASDPWALPLLVGLGIDELSVHPPLVATVKKRIRELNAAACARAARSALSLDSAAAVRRMLLRRGLAPEGRSGKRGEL